MNPNEVILVNEKDEVLGFMDKMEAHLQGRLHRAISVFIFNTKNEWLLQQRAPHKYHSGLKWSNAACTHPMSNEMEIDAANRRLTEEMGMESELEKLFSFQYKAELDNELIEHELDHVFVGKTDNIPVVNEQEVCNYRYISTTDLKKELETKPENFSAWFKLLFDRIQKEIEK